MSKCKIFLACILCLALVYTTAMAVEKSVPGMNGDERLVLQLTNPGKSITPARDEDDFMTFRFMVSSDGGDNWSEIRGTGDTGMWEDEETPAWGGPSYDFGAVVDQENNLHFIAILNAFTEVGNLDRVNGVYDICTDAAAENVSYNLIAPEGDDGLLYFSDGGMDADGNLYAIWVKTFEPEEGDAYGELWAARTVDGEWGDPVRIVEGLDPTDNYPHMTPHVGEFFYVIYEMPNAETGQWDHYVAKVPSSLLGEVTVTATGVASGAYYSYYVGSVSAIDQDVDNGFIYFSVRNEDLSGTAVGNSENGVDWNIETIPGAQRYPSVALQTGDQIPWVFSNYGVPAEGPHRCWCTYDELGYNGGGWLEDLIEPSEVPFDGTENLLYCHMGDWTSEGRLVSGVNVWGYFTPDGFMINTSDDNGESWNGQQRIWHIFEDGLRGGYIAQNHLLTGPDNYVWVAFCGQYGESDISGPEFTTTDMSSVMLGEPKVVSVDVTDASPLYVYNEDPLIYYIMFNWIKVSDDTAFVWDVVLADSMDVDEEGHGTYFFTMPDEVLYMYWENDTLKSRYEPLSAGDVVNFYADGYDEATNYGAEHNGDWFNVWTVNEGWTEVRESDSSIPVEFEVGQNYPNPFNSSTVIPFSLNRPSNVKVSVYDVNGRLVDTVFEGKVTAGRHNVSWIGEGVTSGVYIYTLEADNVRHVGKMILVR